MPVFKYVGRNSKGSIKKGTIDTVSRSQAIQELRNKGISPREIKEVEATIFNRDISLGSRRIKNEDFVIYCRQFATLIRAGVSLLHSTNILAQQTESKPLQKALVQVEGEIKEGQSFSNAVEEHEDIFPSLFINMIRAGEVTGNLDETLDRLASYYEKQNTLRKKIQSTMAYPIILLIVVAIVVVFLLLTIVPQFVSMFEDLETELPLITQIVVAMSNFIQYSWWLGALILVGSGIAFRFFYKNNKRFHYGVHLAIFKMPIFGKLLQKAAIARMTRTLSSLFASSVPILQALTIVERVVGNPIIGKVLLASRDSLEEGRPLSEPISNSWVFPPLVSQMIAIGEQSGQLDFMLGKVADFYEEDVDRTVDTLKSLIEPIMIVILAGVVGFIVVAIMIPMFSIYTEM